MNQYDNILTMCIILFKRFQGGLWTVFIEKSSVKQADMAKFTKKTGRILDKIQPDIERIVIADVCETMLQLLA